MIILRKLVDRLRGVQSINKLRKRGLKIGKNCTIMGGCIIDPSHCWHIEIGNNVTLAPNVHILAHDASTKVFLNYTRISNVKIGSNVFIGAGAIILPGVTIGDNVVIGAGSVVNENISSGSIAAGCPAKVISSLDAFLTKKRNEMNEENTFSSDYTLRNKKMTEMQKQEMLSSCSRFGKAYVE